MAQSITCPVCGESNPSDMEFCRNCQSRLQPVAGETDAIRPGQPPTKKTTSELEPLLPQWLRDARQKARDAESLAQSTPEEPPREEPKPGESDLLAGLASQSNEEDDEVPDWLAQITGTQSKKKKPVPEENQVKWVELGREESQPESSLDVENQTQGEPEQDVLKDWFKQAAASSETADFRMPSTPEEPPSEGELSAASEPEDLGWLRSLDAATPAPAEAASGEEPPAGASIQPEGTPDWLKRLQAEPTSGGTPQAAEMETPQGANVPDWLKGLGEPTPEPLQESPASEASAPEDTLFEPQLPDWLQRAEPTTPESPVPEETGSDESLFEPKLPDWLSSALPSIEEPAESKPAEPEPVSKEESPPATLPDWVSATSSSQPQVPFDEPASTTSLAPDAEEPVAPSELPDWFAALGSSQPQPLPEEHVEPAPFVSEAREPSAAESSASPLDTPDWLASLRAEQETAAEESTAPAFEAEPPSPEPAAATPAKLPGWLSALDSEQGASKDESNQAFSGEPEPHGTAEEPAAPAAIPEEALTGEDADAIFAAMQTPDWLSAVLPASSPAEENVPAAAAEEEPIGPAELPSWVQAMRPVEAAMAAAPSATEETPTEAQGPLAGLHGVLPAIPGAAAPSSKPKAYSIKLDATEQQQAQAALLERILAAETSPIRMRSAGDLLKSQRVLRWVLSALVIIVLGVVLSSQTQSFQLPSAVPNETIGAIQAIESIPADAPVLLVFDYQPATVGEMEATGASLIDHLLLLKHPGIVLLSTSPTGPALAERFLSTALAERAYTRGTQYVDLGYLPGGLAGVYNFAQNPSATVPLDASARPAWQSTVLARVQRFSDFAAIIVLTDSVESGRTWVEQTQSARGNSLLVLVSSAQAGPMLLPYVDAGQANGMVAGLYGAAGAEQRNAGSPAIYALPGAPPTNGQATGYVRRYWDTYSVGLYLAVIAIVIGGLVNLWLGVRDRRAGVVG